MRDEALKYLYKQLRKLKIAQGRAESKESTPQVDLDNIQRNIDVLEWLIPVVLKEDVDGQMQ